MYALEQIATVHLEITSRCNAHCPMCARNMHGGRTNPRLPITELGLEDIQKMLPPSVLAGLKKIYLCGNYGDPAAAKDTLAVFDYFRKSNPRIRLEMFTNGSIRHEDWWRSLAALTDRVYWGIDGPDEVNSHYRRGTSFESVMRNAQAFIGAGGEAHWDYIVFRHNEHLVNDARALSERMGFRGFRAKKTGRFYSNQRSAVKQSHEVWDANGQVLYSLEMPKGKEFRNSALEREQEIEAKYGSMEKYLDFTPIQCKVLAEKSVYISAEGLVFPCCWTANQLYSWYLKPGSTQIEKMLAQLPQGVAEINALVNPLSKILNGDFFQKLPELWGRGGLATGKPKVCAKICGSDFDPFREQFQ